MTHEKIKKNKIDIFTIYVLKRCCISVQHLLKNVGVARLLLDSEKDGQGVQFPSPPLFNYTKVV
jgi:hypothetical protein